MNSSENIPVHFLPFAFLIGGEWEGQFADESTTDIQHFEWESEGRFIRNRHRSHGERGGHQGQAVYAYDPMDQRVVFFYWDTTGGTSRGHILARDGELHAEEEYRGAESYKMRSVWRPVDTDTYDAEQFAWQAGEWRKIWTVRYRRS